MAYINSSTNGSSMPETVTFKGAGGQYIPGSTDWYPGSGSGTFTIPTLGYKYADIKASESDVGTGTNIDISGVSTIIVKNAYSIGSYHHMNPDGTWGQWYGGGSGTISVYLHN